MPDRTTVLQTIDTFAIAVGTTPVQLSSDVTFRDAYIDSIFLGVPGAAAQPVFFGNQSVTIANGFPIEVGSSINLRAINDRVLYELQYPLVEIARMLKCATVFSPPIPLIVWDPSQIFVVASAATDLRISLFRSPYV